ncbi:caspase family protein [Massilia litorea]|uniref:Caspase family protein n=1 Tax=Massilia litorea TaxID=2769491 RepID=A0A7L9U8F0_9BURK|nr:caspase family protein [Massilia litorea]QOL51333.1 caspase family protein [Massilia litorea]
MTNSFLRVLALLTVLLLGGCAASQMHGYEPTYYSYNVPQPLLDAVRLKLRQNGLVDAGIVRDSTGRVRLAGSYANEDEVDRAFVIVQSIVGIKSTSPFYPENVKLTRWESEASRALAANTTASRADTRPGRRIAFVVGINTFKDSKHFKPVPGEDDARVVMRSAEKAGYSVISLLGSQATKAAIEAALARVERDLRPQDSLFIYVSTHGTQPLPTPQGGDNRRMSIVAWDSGDASINNEPDYYLNLQRTAVSDTLVQQLAKKPTRNTRILIDTCYSGEMLRGLPDASGGYIARTNHGAPERAGISLASWTGPAFTAKGIRQAFEGPPADLGKGKAARTTLADELGSERAYTIITATSEGEQSLAPGNPDSTFTLGARQLKGSFFTQAFFAYLDEAQGHVEPAFEKAREFTRNKAQEVSRGERTQVPRHFATQSADRNSL